MQRLIKYSLLLTVLGVLGMGSHLKGDNVSCRLEVETLEDSCRFTLIVKNNSNSEVTLQFPTSQQYDFVVENTEGKVVWEWGKGKMFAQVLTSLMLGPNEEKEFTEEYSFQKGEYRAQGILVTAPNKIYTECVDFSVSEGQAPALKGRITKILDKLYFLGKDGTAYLIENPKEEFENLENKTIEVIKYKAEPIPETVDKKIIIEKYTEEINAEY